MELPTALIPGIYNSCDQWCMYCPATDKCLAFRYSAPDATEEELQDIYRMMARRMVDGMLRLRALNAAEGHQIPELEALLSTDPAARERIPHIDDSLERMGRRYARLSDAYLLSRPDFPFLMKHRAGGPTPFEVFAWYHSLIGVKIYRALVARAAAVRGDTGRDVEAVASAKTALIGIDRSRAAIQEMQQADDDVRLDEMAAHLRRLARELEGRFPDARSFNRPGLDNGG